MTVDLRKELSTRDTVLGSETEALIRNVTPLLWHTLSTFPSGTSHTPQHTQTVEQIAGMLLAPEMLRQLSGDEIQLLILACHFHDLGMAGTEFENRNREAQEQARRDHAIRIGEIIIESWRQLGFRNRILAELLAEVCRGHRPVKVDGHANWEEIRRTGIVAPGRQVRLRLLSALIYAADELHIGSDRASEREEDWLRIENEESRRHWRRHQRITGPAPLDGSLIFECRPTTVTVEKDLRNQVLLKAFSAVRDAGSQLAAEGVTGSLPEIRVQWLRSDLWQLLLLQILCDHTPRSVDDLALEVRRRFDEQTQDVTQLSDLCFEDEERGELGRTVRDWRSRKRLTPCSDLEEKFLLSEEPRIATAFFRIARQADDDDVLFAGQYASHHEFDLLKSSYGRAYARKLLAPIVSDGFGVDLTPENTDSAVASVLHASPTATQMLSEFTPAPSVLVKRHLLSLTVLAGASHDLLRSPDLALDGSFREAVKRLSAEVSDNQEAFLRLVEELALVSGYSYDQVCEAMKHSNAALQERLSGSRHDGQAGLQGKINLQNMRTIRPELPVTSLAFPSLILAGQRARVPVEMVNTEDAPFQVKVQSGTEDESTNSPPAFIMFGPGEPQLPSRVDMRATFSFDASAQAAQMHLRTPDGNREDGLPLIIGIAGFMMKQGGTGPITVGYYWPAVTAQMTEEMANAIEQSESETVEWRFVAFKDGRIMGSQKFDRGDADKFLPHLFERKLTQFLCSVAEDIPLPLTLPEGEVEELENGGASERAEIIQKYASTPFENKKKVTTITLQCTTAEGVVFMDEFLGLFPTVQIPPPEIRETADLSQLELNQRWERPTERMVIGASFSEDHFALADEIREWANCPTQPFPLNLGSGNPPSPIFKTRFEIVVCPYIDRFWYVERPVLMRVRPIRRAEQWSIEADYWESKGDDARAALLRERVANAAAVAPKPEAPESGPDEIQ